MTAIRDVVSYINAHKNKSLERLIDLCEIPSISTLPDHESDMRQAAEWLANEMQSLGMESIKIIPTDGHPVVYGDYLNVEDSPTVLIYGHYDVQPADPLGEWSSSPFVPTIRGDNLYARGASDMKGQIMGVFSALEAWKNAGDGFPLNIKIILEGEEEIGSPNLAGFVENNRDLLSCDLCMNADSSIGSVDHPAIVYGLRGLAYYELWVYGPETDLHSGMFGGAVHNPAIVLCKLISGMHEADNTITLPLFYENVEDISEVERLEINKLPYDDQELLSSTGNPPALFGEFGYSSMERISVRPSLDVNGLYAGFIGSGSKTVIPSKAMVKLSMRLVPHQKPAEISDSLRKYLSDNAPDTVRWELKELAHASPVVVNRASIGVRAAVDAIESVFGVQPRFMRSGGTVPVVGMLSDMLEIETVMLGFALNDDGIHGPNEKLHLETFHNGIESYAHFFNNLAKSSN